MADKPTAPWFAAKWSEEDGGNVGTCADYPSLSHIAPTPEGPSRESNGWWRRWKALTGNRPGASRSRMGVHDRQMAWEL